MANAVLLPNADFDEQTTRAALTGLFDEILLQSRAFAEALHHLSRIADQPDIKRVLLELSRATRDDLLLQPAQATAAMQKLDSSLARYQLALRAMTAEIPGLALNAAGMAEQIRTIPFHPMPMWASHLQSDQPRIGSFNDVWVASEDQLRVLMGGG